MKLSTDFAQTFENLPNDIQFHVEKWKEVRKLLILILGKKFALYLIDCFGL
jgi:hypothetical protein